MNPDTGEPDLELAGGWETLLEGAARAVLEESVLPRFLPRQRWFGAKARQVRATRIVDVALRSCGPALAYWTLIEVHFGAGAPELYFLPLAVVPAGDAVLAQHSGRRHVLARLHGPAGQAILCDALAHADVGAALLDAIATGQSWPTRHGTLHAYATSAFAALRGDASIALAVELAPATSSNSLVMFGQRLLLKLFRRLEVGVNPDFEVGRFLTEKSPFRRIPRAAGTLEYHRPGMGPVTLAILQERIANQGDGWHYTLGELERYYERAAARPHAPAPHEPGDLAEPPTDVRATMADYLDVAATLGRRTAELHLALAGNPDEPAFAPEPLTPADLEALSAQLWQQGQEALHTLRGNLDRLPAALAAAARRLLDEGPRVLENFRQRLVLRPGAARIRCHGDYHLGQVLWVEGDFYLIDFEGEPTRTIEERRARQSPLKDVAGMLRSFNYAAYAGLFAHVQNHPAEAARLEPWAELWHQWTSAVFVRQYRASAAGARLVPADPEEFRALLGRFLLDKAFYELVYELNNRPDWVRIPLHGILRVPTTSSNEG